MNRKLIKLISAVGILIAIPVDVLAEDVKPAVEESTNNQVQEPSRKVALGSSLTDTQIAQTLELFGANNINENNIITISGIEINELIGDGSDKTTPVHLSTMVESRPEGYGVRVQNVTPETLDNLPSDSYRNALITAGVKDSLVKMSSQTPVKSLNSLSGVYTIYSHFGEPLNSDNITVAQLELQLVEKLLEDESLNPHDVNQLLTNIKKRISTPSDIDSVIKEEVEALFKEREFTELELLNQFFENFSKLDMEPIIQQLNASNNMSFRKAIDFYNSIDSSVTKQTFGSETYDEGNWDGISELEKSIILKYGDDGDFYTFMESDGVVNIIISAKQPEVDESGEVTGVEGELYRIIVDKNTRLVLGVKNTAVYEGEIFAGELDESNVLKYLTNVMYPGASDLKVSHFEESTDTPGFDIILEFEDGLVDNYRVKVDGWIELINNRELSGYKTGFLGMEREGTVEGLFSEEKTEALNTLVDNFAKETGQTFIRSTPYAPGDMYGAMFPNDILDTLAVDGQPVKAEWYENVSSTDDTLIVVGAYGAEIISAKPADFYLFAIYNGQPVVLHSNQNQGTPDGLKHFRIVDESSLQQGFSSIVNQ